MRFGKASKLATLALAGAGLFVSTGCDKIARYEGKYEGHNVMVRRETNGFRMLNMYADGWAGGLNAKDFQGDDRFDEISMNVAKGCPLEKYATLDKLEEIADSVERPENLK